MPSSKHPALVLALVVAIGGALVVLWRPDEVEVRVDHWGHARDKPDCSCVHDDAVPRSKSAQDPAASSARDEDPEVAASRGSDATRH